MLGKILSFKHSAKGGKVVFTDNMMEQGEDTFKKITLEVSREPSSSMKISLRTLLTHALVFYGLDGGKLQEKEVKARKVVDLPEFKKYDVTGFVISGDEEEEKISVQLEYTSIRGDKIAMVCKGIPTRSEAYEHSMYLAQDLDTLIEEVVKFVDGENYEVQGDLFKQTENKVKNEESFERF